MTELDEFEKLVIEVREYHSKPRQGRSMMHNRILYWAGQVVDRWGKNDGHQPKVTATLHIREQPFLFNNKRTIYPNPYEIEVGTPFLVKRTYVGNLDEYTIVFATDPTTAVEAMAMSDGIMSVEVLNPSIFWVSTSNKLEEVEA